MRGTPAFLAGTLAATALFPALAAAPVRAQSLGGWSLPAPEASNAAPAAHPAAQGPVDAQNPVVRPAASETSAPETAAPEPTVSASPAPAPVITPPPVRAAPQAAPRSGSTPSPARPAPAPASEPFAAAPAGTPQPEPAPAVTEPASRTVPTSPAPDGSWPAWWWMLPAGLAMLAAAFLLWRRRSRQEESEAPEAPVTPPAPRPSPALRPAPAPERPRAGGDLLFEPTAMRLSLVYATLQFRLVLTAKTEIPPGKLMAGMISAHGSLPQAMQLAPPVEALDMVQAFPATAPGQVLEVKGELQVPLASVRPVQRGGASFMVPLVRLALLGEDGPALPRLELGFVFTVGLAGDGPALAPLRIDTGPRSFTGLATREIESARRTVLLGLDPARAAG